VRHDKLVRDRIPEIVEAAGKHPVYRILDAAEFRVAVCEKLIEEAKETAAATGDERLSELADLAETLDAALAAHGFTHDHLRARRDARRRERGAFERRVFLESVEE
jgi:predicted house-cleaning noncanonical NTP pyrophosphatase (MazG superfamily)